VEHLSPAVTWPPFDSLYRLTLALGVGLFIGLEREWRGKEAGLRTFGFAALLGAMGGMLGDGFAMLCVGLLGILVFVLNWQSLRSNQGAELTTSAALFVTGVAGVLCGKGHTITPAAIGVVTAGLLAWKERLAIFSHKLTAEELRAEILLAILTFAIYPVLPTHAVDPWGLIEPQAAWMTVILIASIGFVNYILWKLFGENGMEFTGFLGGLVNSTVAVTELSNRVKETHGRLQEVVYRGVLLSTAAMALRNALLLGILAFAALRASLLPLFLILMPCAFLVWRSKRKPHVPTADGPVLPLQSPFSLTSALKFGLIFLVMQMIGTAANSALGQFGFYAVSIVGGFVSSATSVASAAALVSHGKISASVGGTGAVLASLASAGMNMALVIRFSGQKRLNQRLATAHIFALALAVAGMVIQSTLWP
jgi:uncharacterized membrane protein (DUF4010 family)